MTLSKQLSEEFNREVENYRRALLCLARQCEWEEFKRHAGKLFDYLEQVESAVRERTFFRIFFGILAVLAAAILVMLGWNPGNHEWQVYRQNFLFAALATSSFELFFYLNFRSYAAARASILRRRKDAFIHSLEQDFREYTGEQVSLAA